MAEHTTFNPFDQINSDLSEIKARLAELARVIGTPATTEKKYYPIAEAAKKLGVAEITLYRGAQAGKIPSKKIGSRVMIPGSYVDK